MQSDSLREEPFGLGGDAQGLWDLLRHLDDWTCVDVSPEVAPRLGALIRDATGKRVCYYGDVYHKLTKPAPLFDEPAVRELTRDDLGLLQAAGVDGAGFAAASRPCSRREPSPARWWTAGSWARPRRPP